MPASSHQLRNLCPFYRDNSPVSSRHLPTAPDRSNPCRDDYNVLNLRQHELPLSKQALAILKRQPHRNSSDFLFGERGFNVFGRAKQELDQRLRIAPWHLHDLRRTAATGMAELGIQPWYVEAVLNHQSGHKQGVAGTYNRAKYADEMRSALQRWADYVDKITSE